MCFCQKVIQRPLAIIDKRCQGHNVAEVMNLISDVYGNVVILDDMIDTAGSISKGLALHVEGTKEVYACCTQAVFCPCNQEVVKWSVLRSDCCKHNPIKGTTLLPIANYSFSCRSFRRDHLTCS